jgi:hypothetical protein
MTLTRVAHSQKASVEGWSFGFGELDSIISKVIDESLENSFDDFPPNLWMPFEWSGVDSDGAGGDAVSDPLTFYINLDVFSEDADVGPLWQTTLRDVVQDCLRLWRDGDEDEGPICEDRIEQAQQIRDALRSLADSIDAEIRKAQEQGP